MISTAEKMCSPEVKFVKNPNRMSPSGISMFYAGFDLKTAKLETVDNNDPNKPFYTFVKFSTNEELTIIDFSMLPDHISKWDVDNLNNSYPLRFLHDFVEDLSKPIKRDGMEHIEYVPTQIITEYLRYSFSHIHSPGTKVNGIIFQSSKIKGHNSCVLFFDHEESLTNLNFLSNTLTRKKISSKRSL
jgi:hypothetical protein